MNKEVFEQKAKIVDKEYTKDINLKPRVNTKNYIKIDKKEGEEGRLGGGEDNIYLPVKAHKAGSLLGTA